MRRALTLSMLVLVLSSCTRQVPLRIGPLSLVAGLSLLEVRVWNGPSCPGDAREAADPATLDDVAVVRTFAGARDAPPVGAVPGGAHAVTVVVRDDACNVVLYGCTPNVDFATASTVDVTWAPPVGASFACESGYACESGACFESRDVDASVGDAS